MRKRIITITVGTLTIICIAIMFTFNEYEKSITTSSTSLSNTKIGWGVKRVPNHEQPDLGKTNIDLMEEYHGIALCQS